MIYELRNTGEEKSALRTLIFPLPFVTLALILTSIRPAITPIFLKPRLNDGVFFGRLLGESKRLFFLPPIDIILPLHKPLNPTCGIWYICHYDSLSPMGLFSGYLTRTLGLDLVKQSLLRNFFYFLHCRLERFFAIIP